MYRTIIADDEKWICDAIVAVLNSAIPELAPLQVFHNGKYAYDHVYQHGGDILLLDIEMPGKSGLDIAQLVADRGDNCFVAIITAYQDFEYAKRAINCNVNAFLVKPFSSMQLVETVRKGIAQLEKSKIRSDSRHSSNRNLLKAICTDYHLGIPADIRLCGGLVPLEELLCTELFVRDDGLAKLPPEAKAALENDLYSLAEKDQDDASIFLMECQDTVKILVFSKESPEENSFCAIADMVSHHTGSSAKTQIRRWDSFGQYLRSLEFRSRIDGYFQQVIDCNHKQAHESIAQYIFGLSEADRKCMAVFLVEKYSTACTADPAAILQCLDDLACQYLPSNSQNVIVASACDYIQKNFGSSTLSLHTMAETLFISRAHISRLLKKHTGYSFSAYLQKVRMEQAKTLLETTSLSTSEIAAATGYETPAYFRSAFKSHFHMTPRQYRQLICGKEQSES